MFTIKESLQPHRIIKNIIFPDKFVDHNTPDNQYKEVGMDAESISNKILSLISNEVVHFSNYTKK